MKTTKMSNSNKVDLYCYDIYGTLNYTHLEDYATQHEHIKRLEKKSLSGREKRELTILKKKLNDD